jgi:electron transfer flavoprotein-quinone oxidoreductase
MAPKYDLIVVGSGPGGTAAAKVAAEKKLKVLLLERGRTPGDKQMSGSYLWRNISEEIFPGFEKAEFHKGMPRWCGMTLNHELDNDIKRYGFNMRCGTEAMRNLMTVYRNETDKWFAEQTAKAGAELKMALVTDLIWESKGEENARVKGVVTDKGNFEAPVVIDASGLNSLIAERAGLAKWTPEKVQLGLKYIFKVDEKVLRERMNTFFDDDGVEVDPIAVPTSLGLTPEYFGAHVQGCPGRGIVTVTLYQTLAELMRERINSHQRMQWYLKMPEVQRMIKGGEFIQCNLHALATGDMQGYVPKSFLPGLILVGDAGGFAQPLDNFGANCAQWQGRMAGELAAEMKEKKDYSEAMFAKYEKAWRDSWIGEDETTEWNVFIRKGSLKTLVKCIDEVVCHIFSNKWENVSYPSMIIGALPKLLPAVPSLMETPYMMKRMVGVVMKKAGPFMQMLGIKTETE